MIDDQPPTLEEVSDEQLKIEELMKTKQQKEQEWFAKRQAQADAEKEGCTYIEEVSEPAVDDEDRDLEKDMDEREEIENVLLDENRVREGMKKVSQDQIIAEMLKSQ